MWSNENNYFKFEVPVLFQCGFFCVLMQIKKKRGFKICKGASCDYTQILGIYRI